MFSFSNIVSRIASILFLAGFAVVAAQAQTPSLGQYQLGAGYSNVSGPTDNGTLLTFAKQFGSTVWGQAKTFMLANPAGVGIYSVGPRYRPHPFKANEYFDASKLYPFVDLNLGAIKDPAGKTTFAYGAGVGVDYQISSNVTLMVIEADIYGTKSPFFPRGFVAISNVHQVASGVKFTF